ncbi:MAG: SAM-dependent chlorinase/fluorinase, partial [Deltaproteobacteria bacterium]
MKKERGIITLLTDFGTADSYVSAMKGVILSINPDATIIDISHQIPPQDITTGAFVVSQSAPFFPKGTVHIAVVDPGVGGKRKPILIQTDRYFFVGPDNGIFSIALQRERVKRKIHLTNKDYFLGHISSTFHGR